MMTFRRDTPEDMDERSEEQRLRTLAGGEEDLASPPPSYWGRQIVRVNERLDVVTSGRALTVNWAWKVAIPGVFALISFFVALDYYVPEPPGTGRALTEVVRSLPAATLDSLLAESRLDDAWTTSGGTGYEQVYAVSQDHINAYMLTNGEPSVILESLSQDELDALLASLNQEQQSL